MTALADSGIVIPSKLFGPVEVPPEKQFRFPDGLPGLEQLRIFTFLNVAEYEPLIWMVNDSGDCHLPVIPLANLTEADIDDVSQTVYLPQLRRRLIEQPTVVVYVILKLAGAVQRINLRAPVLVDYATQTGRQVILDRFVLPEGRG